MALNTYSLVKTAMQTTWLQTSTTDITSGNADDILTLAEERIVDDIMARGGIRDWETALTSTITGSGTIAVPSGYIELKNAYINQAPVQWLDRKSAEWIYATYPTRSSAGLPKTIAREASNFIFGPYPDSQYTVSGIYYARPSTVINGATFTGVFLTHPSLLLFCGLVNTEPFLGRDARLAVWEREYQLALDRVVTLDQRERISGSPLQVRVR